MEADIYNSALTPEMDQIIDKVFSQTATDLEFARLTEWLGKDAANRRIFMQQQVIYENMHPAFDPSTVDAEGACRHVARKINRSRWRSAAKISIAALVALVAGVAASVWYFGSRTASEAPRRVSVTSPHGGAIETELPDGSHVWLNSNSRLDYPVEFQGNERRIALSVEGYFEVKADREHPFIVATQGIEVTATGTAFNVNSYAGKSVGVTLVEGHVNVCDNSSGISTSIPMSICRSTIMWCTSRVMRVLTNGAPGARGCCFSTTMRWKMCSTVCRRYIRPTLSSATLRWPEPVATRASRGRHSATSCTCWR